MIRSFNHIGISVGDLDRSIGFYTQVLGMELLGAPFPFGGATLDAVLALDHVAGRMGVVRGANLQIELFEFAVPRPAAQDPDRPVNDHGITHFGFEVDDIAAAFARIAAAGARFHCPVTQFPSGVKAAYGRDPDGNVFELLEMPGRIGG